MKTYLNIKNINSFDPGILTAGVLALLIALMFGNGASVLAHGGEDHGDAKPQAQTNTKGTVTQTAKMGDLELMIKYVLLEPDTAAQGRLFLTRFETNEAVDGSKVKVEIESASGTVTSIPVDKSDSVGSYTLKIPALPEGVYTLRAKLDLGGKTDTATFSGIQVAHPTGEVQGDGTPWLRNILILIVGSAVLLMFGSLIYFVWRFAGGEQVGDEAVTV